MHTHLEICVFRGFHRISICLFALLWISAGNPAAAQSVPTPAPAQELPVIFRNATIHTGTGEVLTGADLLIEAGKITGIGRVTTTFKVSREINCEGKHIYPGLIAMNTTLGLLEIDQVRATADYNESGRVNPNSRAIIGYNTDSRVIPTVRSNGILIAQIAPRGGLLSGTSGVVHLDAWNWEDAAMATDEGIFMSWPELDIGVTVDKKDRKNREKEIEKERRELEDVFDAASAYRLAKSTGYLRTSDLRYEAMLPMLERKMNLYIRANSEKQIRSAVEFGIRRDIRIVIVGGSSSWKLTELLRENRIPVVLGSVHSLPETEDEDTDLPFRLPGMLKAAGVSFCISEEGFWQQRNLSFQAGTAAAYGLNKEEALRAITLEPAKIMGIDGRCGSLELGKDATLLVTAGDLLDMITSNVEMAFIQGREIDLGNKQKDLYLKFREKYFGVD